MCHRIVEAFQEMAMNNANLFIAQVDDLKDVGHDNPEVMEGTVKLLSIIGAGTGSASGLDIAAFIASLLDRPKEDSKSASYLLRELRRVAESHPTAALTHAPIIHRYLKSRNKEARNHAHELAQVIKDISTICRF